MGRVKVNLTIDESITKEARALGLNMSRVAEKAIAEVSRAERNRLWRLQNAASIEAYDREVAQGGLPLSRFRSF